MEDWTRLSLIDFMRGIAVVLMLIYHVFFDLNYFNKIQIDMYTPFWYSFPRFIGGTFIFVSGISLTLARSKYGGLLTEKTIKRALKFLFWGLLISLATLPTLCMVRFGILHFFALAILISHFFAKYRFLPALVGFWVILLSFIINDITIEGEYLLWMGIKPTVFCTLDYYPLFPWLGVMLFGIFVGNSFFVGSQSKFFKFRITRFFSPILILGRNSLKIYLIQHPLILLLMQLYYGDVFLSAISKITGFF